MSGHGKRSNEGQAARPMRRLAFSFPPLSLFFFLAGCAAPMVQLQKDWDPALIPRQSPDAREILLLQSNFNCQYFIDGQPLARGRRVRIGVTNQPHQVVCKPDGYRAKEEYVNPPYRDGAAIGFTFMIEDKLTEGAVAAGAAPKAPEQELLLPSDVDTAPKSITKTKKNAYAVLVGIEKYRDLPQVDFAARDAETMKDYLVRSMGYPEENIMLTTNDRATRSDIESYFETWLKNNVEKDSPVFIFFAGHGSPDPKSGDAYLVPYDGNPSFLQSSAYPLKRLYQSLGKLPTKNILVVMDSCFSGAGGRSVIAKGTRPLVAKSEETFNAPEGITVVAAASGEQVSSFYPEKRHGLLTYFFLKGLQGDADANRDGSVDVGEIFNYLKPNVVKTARKINNVEQTPQLMPSASAPGSRSDLKLIAFP